MAEHKLIDRIYYPLLGVELPTWPDLLERCDEQAHAVLLAAGRLAGYRRQCLQGLEQIYADYRLQSCWRGPAPRRRAERRMLFHGAIIA